MTIREAIQKFVDSRELDNCSAKGIKTYRERLGYFVTWLEVVHAIVNEESRVTIPFSETPMKQHKAM